MGYIRISKQLQRIQRAPQLVEPKTERSRRTLAMPPMIANALTEHHARRIMRELQQDGAGHLEGGEQRSAADRRLRYLGDPGGTPGRQPDTQADTHHSDAYGQPDHDEVHRHDRPEGAGRRLRDQNRQSRLDVCRGCGNDSWQLPA